MTEAQTTTLKPTLGWYSATAIVAGSMVGSGIFIVSADIARLLGSAGLLILVWLIAGFITILGAVSYGKLAAHLPRAGGQYVFLRESWGRLMGFLYGWVLLTVIQTGFLAAVAVAFAKFAGVLFPAISSEPFWQILGFELTSQKVLAVLVLMGLTAFNCTGIKNGAVLQNIFTSLKVLSLLLLIVVGLAFGNHLWDGTHNWSLALPTHHDVPGSLVTLIAFASVGSLFSADAWNYVTFIGAEVKNPERNLPKALLYGAGAVVVLYILANFAYLNLLSLPDIQHASEDRVATAAMNVVFPGLGVQLMAVVILISTFGCLNGMLLSGARVFYAMACDGLLFRKFGELHPTHGSPNFAMGIQMLWAICLTLSGSYGKLLDYIVFSSLLFYIITMAGLLRLGKTIPEQVQLTRPIDKLIPWLYIIGASFIAFYLLFGDFMNGDFQSKIDAGQFFDTKFFTSLAGVLFTLSGWPIYAIWTARQK